jgi:hypothetical protein
MYPDEWPEFLPFAAGAERKQLRNIEKYQYSQKGCKQIYESMHIYHRFIGIWQTQDLCRKY